MGELAIADRVEVLVLVDNVTDSLSTAPEFAGFLPGSNASRRNGRFSSVGKHREDHSRDGRRYARIQPQPWERHSRCSQSRPLFNGQAFDRLINLRGQ